MLFIYLLTRTITTTKTNRKRKSPPTATKMQCLFVCIDFFVHTLYESLLREFLSGIWISISANFFFLIWVQDVGFYMFRCCRYDLSSWFFKIVRPRSKIDTVLCLLRVGEKEGCRIGFFFPGISSEHQCSFLFFCLLSSENQPSVFKEYSFSSVCTSSESTLLNLKSILCGKKNYLKCLNLEWPRILSNCCILGSESCW